MLSLFTFLYFVPCNALLSLLPLLLLPCHLVHLTLPSTSYYTLLSVTWLISQQLFISPFFVVTLPCLFFLPSTTPSLPLLASNASIIIYLCFALCNTLTSKHQFTSFYLIHSRAFPSSITPSLPLSFSHPMLPFPSSEVLLSRTSLWFPNNYYFVTFFLYAAVFFSIFHHFWVAHSHIRSFPYSHLIACFSLHDFPTIFSLLSYACLLLSRFPLPFHTLHIAFNTLLVLSSFTYLLSLRCNTCLRLSMFSLPWNLHRYASIYRRTFPDSTRLRLPIVSYSLLSLNASL